MKFVSYSGAGNTFFLADNRSLCFHKSRVLSVCLAGQVDGIILVEPSTSADAFMRIFNRDGSEAEMCGNGLRCFIHFLKELGFERSIYTIDTLAGKHQGWFVKDQVCIQLFPPSNLQLHLTENIHFINTGVPHAVKFVSSLDTLNVNEEGNILRHSPLFNPDGANINFVTVRDTQSLSVRTFERGVEAETSACGTGATAAALIASRIYSLASPIHVYVRSKEILKICFNYDWSQVSLEGSAQRLQEGNF